MTRRLVAAAGAALSLCLASAPAAAQTTTELRWDPALDLTVTLGGAATWTVSEIFKPDLAPPHCHWCKVDSVDAGVRDALIWRSTASAERLSDVTGFILTPLAALGLNALAAAHQGAMGNVPEDALLVLEAGVIDANVTQITKLLVGRERPFVHALSPDQKPLTAHPADNNMSFFSGHASEAFALAAAAGTVSTMRGYRYAPLTWAVAGTFAATTGYLRIAADVHWLTDVIVGALVGVAIGIAVPFVFHQPVADPARPTPAAQGAAPIVTLSW